MKQYNIGLIVLQSHLIEEVKKWGIERTEDLIKSVYESMPETRAILLDELYSLYKYGKPSRIK